MSAKFLETVDTKLAERWVATLFTPAFIFWTGGAISALQHFGWQKINHWLTQLEAPFRTAILIFIFCGILVSGFVIQRFDLSILRFLEGYWNHPVLWPLKPLHNRLTTRMEHRNRRISQQWQQLNRLPQPTREQRTQMARLDWEQHHFPTENILPTRLGNLLSSAESHSTERYGLDAIVCWPRLWLLLPEPVKKELQTARADLDAAARSWLWSLLFMAWGLWVWWLMPLGFLATLWSYYGWAVPAAANYGMLIRSSFDLYRKLLYDSLRWQLPDDPSEERRMGKELTAYLWRGM